MFDVIIVGAGPAGLTAALYCSRRKLSTLVISKDLGGQAVLTDQIYNYPGIKFMAGLPMMTVFKEQAEQYGAQVMFDEVVKIVANGDQFTVATSSQQFESKTVILAFGLTPRDLGVAGEEQFKGTHIHHEVLQHVNTYAGKEVAVIGGGNSAIEAVRTLSPLVKRVYLIHRSDRFRAEEITVNEVQALGNVEFILNSEVSALGTEKTWNGLEVKNTQGDLRHIDAEGVFVKIGYRTYTQWLADLVERDTRGNILTTRDCETKTAGLFAAGDCTDMPYKQIITSGGEGCKAAMKAYEYLLKKAGKRAVMIDWS